MECTLAWCSQSLSLSQNAFCIHYLPPVKVFLNDNFEEHFKTLNIKSKLNFCYLYTIWHSVISQCFVRTGRYQTWLCWLGVSSWCCFHSATFLHLIYPHFSCSACLATTDAMFFQNILSANPVFIKLGNWDRNFNSSDKQFPRKRVNICCKTWNEKRLEANPLPPTPAWQYFFFLFFCIFAVQDFVVLI